MGKKYTGQRYMLIDIQQEPARDIKLRRKMIAGSIRKISIIIDEDREERDYTKTYHLFDSIPDYLTAHLNPNQKRELIKSLADSLYENYQEEADQNCEG